MLKLNASFSKKVPAEEEYSSQSYHAAVEVELPDGLTPEQLRGRIHDTFELVRDSVQAELRGSQSSANAPVPFPKTSGRKEIPPASCRRRTLSPLRRASKVAL